MAKFKALIGADTPAEVRERLQLLQNAAESKLLLFKNDLKERLKDPLYMGGDAILMETSGIRAQASTDLNTAISGIADEVFMGGTDQLKMNVLGAVKAVIGTILGSGEGGVAEKRMLVPITEGSLPLALHVYVWKYTFSTKEIIGKTDNAIAYLIAKAAFKPEKVTKEGLATVVASDAPGMAALIQDTIAAAAPLQQKSFGEIEHLMYSFRSPDM